MSKPTTRKITIETYQCETCNFTHQNETLVKIHYKEAHTKTIESFRKMMYEIPEYQPFDYIIKGEHFIQDGRALFRIGDCIYETYFSMGSMRGDKSKGPFLGCAVERYIDLKQYTTNTIGFYELKKNIKFYEMTNLLKLMLYYAKRAVENNEIKTLGEHERRTSSGSQVIYQTQLDEIGTKC